MCHLSQKCPAFGSVVHLSKMDQSLESLGPDPLPLSLYSCNTICHFVLQCNRAMCNTIKALKHFKWALNPLIPHIRNSHASLILLCALRFVCFNLYISICSIHSFIYLFYRCDWQQPANGTEDGNYPPGNYLSVYHENVAKILIRWIRIIGRIFGSDVPSFWKSANHNKIS